MNVATERSLIVAITVGAIAFFQFLNDGIVPNSSKKHSLSINRIIDGDTIEISVPELPGELPKKLSLRIIGVDTPEKDGTAKCTKEAHKAQLARVYLEQSIMTSKKKDIEILSWDKYGGRVLGDVILDRGRVSELLISDGYAIRYNGEKKTYDWCK